MQRLFYGLIFFGVLISFSNVHAAKDKGSKKCNALLNSFQDKISSDLAEELRMASSNEVITVFLLLPEIPSINTSDEDRLTFQNIQKHTVKLRKL